MSVVDDERGQAIQVGAILLFGILIILLATYQAFVVPSQNRAVEANHAETIAGQMQELRDAIVSVPATGEGAAVTLRLGTTYPARIIALNPSPPTGTIRTEGTETEDVNLTVANAVGTDGEVADFWDGTNRTYDSGILEYRAGYHEFRNAPTIVYDNSLLVHRFEEGNLTRAAQRLIDGTRLSLGTINGSLDETASGATAVDLVATSASPRRISITNETGESIHVEFASQFDADRWREELQDADEFTPNGHVVSVSGRPIPDTSFHLVQVELEQDVTYTLRLARIGVGTGVVDPDETYIAAVDGPNVERNETFRAEVRDRLNNPVSGVTVTPTSSPANCTLDPKPTDEEGRVAYRCDDTGTVELEINGGTTSFEQVSFGIPVVDAQDPAIDTGATTASAQTENFGQGGGPPGGGNSFFVSQVTVEYSVSDQPSGLDHVSLSLRDDADNLVMNTTHVFEGDLSRDGTWVTPWIDESDPSGYTVVIEVFDRAGNSDTFEITL